MVRQLLLCVLAGVCFVLLAGPASVAAEHASLTQAGDDPAKAAYREGAADYALGHFRDALAKFELAYKLKQAPTLLFNIAQCHRQLKEFDEAATTYRSFIRLDPQNAQVDLARQLLGQVEAALSAQHAAQTAPPRDANGHDVPADGKSGSTGASGSALSNSALAANSNGATAQAAHTTGSPAAPAEATARDSAKPAASSSHIPVWIAGGAAVAALGAGGAFGILSKSTANDISSTQHSRADVDSLQSKLNSQSATANVLFAVGAGLALVTGALFFLKF